MGGKQYGIYQFSSDAFLLFLQKCKFGLLLRIFVISALYTTENYVLWVTSHVRVGVRTSRAPRQV